MCMSANSDGALTPDPPILAVAHSPFDVSLHIQMKVDTYGEKPKKIDETNSLVLNKCG
jgi:hypothetical protein